MNDKKNREPMVIALATGKGGSMKTTSAVFWPAPSWTSPGRAARARRRRGRAGRREGLVVQGRRAGRPAAVRRDVRRAGRHRAPAQDQRPSRRPVDWVLIDSAPYGRALDESVNNADLVVIPSSPSRIDLDQAVGVKDLCDRRGVPAAILLCRTEANTTALRDALAWIDAADIACFETLIPKRRDILNAKSTRPRGSRLHEYRDLAAELKRTMRQLKGRRNCEEHELDASSARPDHAAHRRPAGTGGYRKTGIGGNRNTENRKTVKPSDAEGWVKTSVSLRASTRRRLKTFAAEHDMRIREVVDAAPRNVPGL